MHASAHVPRVIVTRRDELQYMEDYRRAYDEAWKMAWLCASSNDTLYDFDVARQAQAMAHAIAVDFADFQYHLRH